MFLQRKLIHTGTGILLCLIFLFGVMGVVSATDLTSQPFADEKEMLVLLKVLPKKDWNPSSWVTYEDYLILIEKLFNGRSSANQINLTGKITIPDGYISYLDALSVAGMFMGYGKDDSFVKVKELTKEVKKTEKARITGYEMSYIFYNLLYSTRVGDTETLIEARYLLGNQEIVSSRVMQIENRSLVLKDEGSLSLASDVQVFHMVNEQLKPASFSLISVGMDGLKLLFSNKGEVQSIILPEKYFPQNIRVLLSEELNSLGGSKSYDFPEILVKATQPFKIITGEKGKERVILVAETGEVIKFTNVNGAVKVQIGSFSETVKNRVYLKSYYNHSISFDALLSTSRHDEVSVYAGILEIFSSNKSGYLYLVNQLSMEQYLKKVLPGQIPASWGLEAYKVMAIAARSYAISQVTHGRFNDKGANVDDSSFSQMYNSISENDIANQAIDETAGMVAMYQNRVIDAVFFATSAGFTANNEDVWHNVRTKEFPGIVVPYLRANSQIFDQEVPGLTSEANALAFFKNQKLKSFDSDAPYFRWKIELGREELENAINRTLPEREKADQVLGTDFVQTLEGRPVDVTDPKFSIGKLKDLRVVRRGVGGNIMILEIMGTEGIYRVSKEYNIRFVLRPHKDITGSEKDIIVLRHDGSSVKNYPILPSAFAVFDIKRDKKGDIEKVTIYGGGNGHGVGMSQWGVKGMVDLDYTYEEILKNYYRSIELVKIY
ncbi:MAG: SpoIID/LytB domain-containing protein [Halanaerobiales bacterium]|nr:SpoIID/LytB domain-containing protein [Halanaerobiales bacterium]